jgi:hypothetical protein
MRALNRLSATFVRGLKRPGKHRDGGGLYVIATASKAKTEAPRLNASYQFRFAIDGTEHWMGLGSTRDVSLSAARDKAREARSLLAEGVNPLTARNAGRMARAAAELRRATFRQCLDQFLDSRGDQWRTKHLNQWRSSTATYCKPLMDVNVADIDVGMVLRCIEGSWKRAPETMDRVRRRIGEVLGYAEVRGLRPPGPNPTRWKDHLDKMLPHPRKLKPVVHHAAPAYADVPALYARLAASDGIPELCLAFVMLTAVRSAEARGARRAVG